MLQNPVNRPDDFKIPVPEKPLEQVAEVYSSNPVKPKDESGGGTGGRQYRNPEKKQEAKDHFAELARAAETAHVALVENNSPYRFCVYREGEEVFIDIVVLNAEAKVDRIIKKKITHEEFHKILQDIGEKEGLFFDKKM